MSRKSHHVVPAPQGGWNVKKGGATRASKHFDNKQDAIGSAREISRKQGTELVIHNKDGTIDRKVSQDHNPSPARRPVIHTNERDNVVSSQPDDEFERNVFINCPFDDEYYTSLLRPLLFTIIYLGFNPRIASERSDSGELRINKICELIQISKFSIHDLSRIKAKRRNEFYRLNMPFDSIRSTSCSRVARRAISGS